MFAQLCGDTQKTNQCNFMKHSEMKKLVQENTTEIKGKAIVMAWTRLNKTRFDSLIKK